MTEKENFMKAIRGEIPAWVPRYAMAGKDPYAKHPTSNMSISPSFYQERRTPQGGFDIFGVEYQSTVETGGMALPVPGKFILQDITKWRDVIKVPDISGLDFNAMAQKDYAAAASRGSDKETMAVIMNTHVGYFQHLMNFMGFTEGLCAMQEEPEEVYALYEYLADFYDEVLRKSLDAYKPDIITVTDDTATAYNPFISMDCFRKLVKPFHARLAQIGHDRGLPVMMHNCGRCEDAIEDWFDYHICAWNPAQIINDLDGIKKKYGTKLVLVGCWDSSGPVGWTDCTEELMRSSVRKTIDRFANGGGFIFWGSTYGPVGDKALENRRRWMTEEYEAYRETPYK